LTISLNDVIFEQNSFCSKTQQMTIKGISAEAQYYAGPLPPPYILDEKVKPKTE